MLLRLPDRLSDHLLNEPESGMGYQIAVVDEDRYLILGTVLAVPIRRARAYLVQESPKPVTIVARGPMLLEGDELYLTEWQVPATGWVDSEDLESLNRMAETWLRGDDPMSTLEELRPLEGSLAKVETHGSYPSQSRPGELFIRYSAFANDRRINSDGSVQSGTYVTTETDARLVPSGLSAVGRYALPKTTPALNRFVLRPPAGTPIHCGAVTPKFGQAGGGVEVQFNSGLPSGTAFGPQPIPER